MIQEMFDYLTVPEPDSKTFFYTSLGSFSTVYTSLGSFSTVMICLRAKLFGVEPQNQNYTINRRRHTQYQRYWKKLTNYIGRDYQASMLQLPLTTQFAEGHCGEIVAANGRSIILREDFPLNEIVPHDPELSEATFHITVEKIEDIRVFKERAKRTELRIKYSVEHPKWTVLFLDEEDIGNASEPYYLGQFDHYDAVHISALSANGIEKPIFAALLQHNIDHPKGKVHIHFACHFTKRLIEYVFSWTPLKELVIENTRAFQDEQHYYGYIFKELATGSGTFSYTLHNSSRAWPVQQNIVDANGGVIAPEAVYKDRCVYLLRKNGLRARLVIRKNKLGGWMLECNAHKVSLVQKQDQAEHLLCAFDFYFLSLTGNAWHDYPDRFVYRKGLYVPVLLRSLLKDGEPTSKRSRDASPKRTHIVH